MGESHHAIRMMGEYTTNGRLHQCYSFEMLGDDFSAAHFRGKISEFFAGAPDGWPMWAFSNHDVPRYAGRWAAHGAGPDALSKLAAGLLLAMQGSVCLWQGEELGQVDTTLGFDELVDPQGINFWPLPIGRDGCRTPMCWEAGRPNAGFSDAAQTWLPVKAPQAARAVDTQAGKTGSVLEFYRRMIAVRKGRADLVEGNTVFLNVPEPLLAFRRGSGTTCIYNLSPAAYSVGIAGTGAMVIGEAAVIGEGRLDLGPNGFAILDGAGTVTA